MAEIGTILGGRYRLVELLGQGGMATIFRAVDTQLGRDVAVKLLRPEYLRDPDFSSRFRQEAQNAASLNHPNVVSVYDYGEDPSGPYIVMEFVDGEDLAAILRRTGSLPPSQAARIAGAVARALAAAHARGIVHRDVKPGNVLIGRDGRVKVADFGIARAVAEAQMTLPGTTLGSVHYFSPEQARGETATNESDIYALGIVLYEMLTGTRPWEGDTAAAVALARLSGTTPDPALVRPSIPPDVAAITRKALAPLPMDRFASAASMADALETSRTVAGGAAAGAAAIAGAGVAAAAGVARSNPTVASYPPDAYAGSGATPAGGPARKPLDEDEGEGASPLVWLAGIAAIALLAAIAFIVFQLLSGPNQPTTPEQVAVPEFVGKLLADATGEADAVGLKLAVTEQPSDQPVGTIIAQDRPAGTLVEVGSTVRVAVASGLEQVPMPDLRNKTEAQAVQEIVTAGLRPGSQDRGFRPGRRNRPRRDAGPGPGRRCRKGQRRRLRHLEGAGTDAQPDAESHTDPDADAHTDPDADADPDPDAHPDPDTDPDPDAHSILISGRGRPTGSSQARSGPARRARSQPRPPTVPAPHC